MRKTFLAAALLLAVGGCNNGSDEPGGSMANPPDTVTDLTITVVADEGATPKTFSLRCDPTGGDHPQPAEACAVLKKAGATVFDPVPKDQACTMIFGGPQTATVVGLFEKKDVDATFSRSNGCEIARWEKLGTTVFDVPLQ